METGYAIPLGAVGESECRMLTMPIGFACLVLLLSCQLQFQQQYAAAGHGAVLQYSSNL